MRLRLAAAVTTAAVALLTPSAQGATARDQVVDPKGDAKIDQANLDIVSARWSTSGRGNDKALVVTLTLNGPAKTQRPFVYELKSEVAGCGTVIFDYAAEPVVDELDRLNQPAVHDDSLAVGVWFECMHGAPGPAGSSGSLHEEVGFAVRHNTITWSVPFRLLPERIPPGAVFSSFEAIADVGEPVYGFSVLGNARQSVDHALGDGIWKMR